MTAESNKIQAECTSQAPKRVQPLRRNASWDIFERVPSEHTQELQDKYEEQQALKNMSDEMLQSSDSMEFDTLSSSDNAAATRRRRDHLQRSVSQNADFDGGLRDSLDELPSRALDRREVTKSARYRKRRNAMQGMSEELPDVSDISLPETLPETRTSQLAF